MQKSIAFEWIAGLGKSVMNKAFLPVLLALTVILMTMSDVRASVENLFDAVKAGDTAAVHRLLERHAQVNVRDDRRMTPLHYAAARGMTGIAVLLIRKGANVNAGDYYRETPLHHAAYWGKIEVAALLIQKGANVNARDENLETPLHYAAEDQPDMAALLIEKGADVNVRDDCLETPLHHSASRGMAGIAALLIRNGAKVDALDENRWTPLHWAAFAGNTEVAELFIQKGADVNARDANGKTPLDWAASQGNTDVVALLVPKGADVNVQGSPIPPKTSPSVTDGGTTPARGPLGRRSSYDQYAGLIAGIGPLRNSPAPFESSPVWTEFAGFCDRNWEKYVKMHLSPVRNWAAGELAEPVSSGLTVFYPFSGPDFANPYTLFPGAGTYILTALEPIGGIPDFQGMSREEFDSFFSEIRKSLHDNLSIDYFVSSHMHTGMDNKGVSGILPYLLFFMAREKAHILDIKYWFMEPDGTIREVPGTESAGPASANSIPGVRIVFETDGSPANKPQTLYYFQLNLYNPIFLRNRHFTGFLRQFGPFITFMKSAAYVMSDRQASGARRFILDQSRYILQEDSGIPLRYFDASAWALRFYGTYTGPIWSFKNKYQADLARIYKTGGDIKPLPFGMGYHFQVDTSNLLFATRK